MKNDHDVGCNARTMSAVKSEVPRPSLRPPTKIMLWFWRAACEVYSKAVRVSVFDPVQPVTLASAVQGRWKLT